MTILTLPDELILVVAETIPAQADLSALCRTNRRLYCLLSDLLHATNIKHGNSSALFYGAEGGNLGIVQRMIDLGADVNSILQEQTVLESAVCNGHADITKYLLEQGAGYRYRRGQPWTPLFSAAAAGETEVVKTFLAHEEVGEQTMPFQAPGTNGHLAAMVQSLLMPDEPVKDPERMEFSIALSLAIAGAHDETARALIVDKRADLNFQDRAGRTLLLWAMSHGRYSLLDPLIKHGADPNITSPSSGRTILEIAISERREEVVASLLAHGQVNPNITTSGPP